MWTRTRCSRLLLTVLFFLVLFSCAGICSANQVYQISETELQTLSDHLSELERNNETLKKILSESGEELTAALNALTESQKELTMLRSELAQCKADALSAKSSLQIANQELQKASESFKASEREHDRIEGRLRTQRNIWEALFAVAVGVAIAK